jgi:hypothetical protein
MLEVSNSGHSDIEVEQIELTHDGINLMTPERPQTESDWTVPSGGVKTISWKPEPDPAASLMRMRPGLGIIMQIPVEFTLTLKSGPSTHEYRQKLAVHVLGTNGEVTQIAG